MDKKSNNNIDKTLTKLSLNKEAPKSAFGLLMLIYAISIFLTIKSSTTQGFVSIAGNYISYSSFTGMFSMLGNICIICLVMLFRRVGYIVSMTLLLMQFPMMTVNVFLRGNLAAISGFFLTF